MLFLLGIQVVNMLGETIVSPLGPSLGIAPKFPGSQPGVLSIGRRPTHVLSCCLKRSNKKLGLALRPDPKEKSLCQTAYSSTFRLWAKYESVRKPRAKILTRPSLRSQSPSNLAGCLAFHVAIKSIAGLEWFVGLWVPCVISISSRWSVA
jgi:hypothetical protein